MSSMGFNSKAAHPAGGATACKQWKERPHNGAPVPRFGDFFRAEGNHMKLSQGLPFVLAVNGGEILLHILEEFKVQLHQDNFPMIVYVEPGPNVSTLDQGTSFTLFLCGRLFLVQVLRVLRQPDNRKAVTINLLSLSLGETVSPESESIQVAPCAGSNPSPSAEIPRYRLSTSLSVQIPDCNLGGPNLSMQMPIPIRAVDPDLLSRNYGWPRSTSPLPLSTLEDAEQAHASKKFVWSLRTPDTPGQIRTDSMTAQHGSLMSRDTTAITDQQIEQGHKIDGVRPNFWPWAHALVPFETGRNVRRFVGRPNSSVEGREARLLRIIRVASEFSRPPGLGGRCSSLNPDLDPTVSVDDVGVCPSPFPAPIGSGRPHVLTSLPPIDQSLLFSKAILPGAFGDQLVRPTAHFHIGP